MKHRGVRGLGRSVIDMFCECCVPSSCSPPFTPCVPSKGVAGARGPPLRWLFLSSRESPAQPLSLSTFGCSWNQEGSSLLGLTIPRPKLTIKFDKHLRVGYGRLPRYKTFPEPQYHTAWKKKKKKYHSWKLNWEVEKNRNKKENKTVFCMPKV